jgi:Tfp pilus assembly protein PilE
MAYIRGLLKREKGEKGEKGTSLVEVLIVAVMMVVVLGSVLAIIETAMNNYVFQTHQMDAQDKVRNADQILVKEIRQAESPLLSVANYSSIEILVFKADLNNDGTAEAIQLTVDRYAKKVTKKVNLTGQMAFENSQSQLIVEDLVNTSGEPVFTYYGTSLTQPLDPNNYQDNVINMTKVIRVWLRIDSDTAKAPVAAENQTFVKLRNFTY